MELTFDRVLAFCGLILAIIIIVLDKAGKLKGPMLLVLLGVAALLTLPLALGNTWVRETPWGMLKFSRGLLAVCLVLLCYSIIAVWISPTANRQEEAKETKEVKSELPEPAFDVPTLVKPDQHGRFAVTFVNVGPDVENIATTTEYFVAERENDQITLNRLAVFREAASPNVLKTNQAGGIYILFSDFFVRVFKFIFARNHCSFMGVKITIDFRRYGDKEAFRKVWVFDAVGNQSGTAPNVLLDSSVDQAGPPETRKDILTASEVMPFIDSEDHWKHAVASFDTKTGNIVDVH